jgi:hypothetical protein
MVPDCHKTALTDLKATLVQHENSLTISSNIVHYFSEFMQKIVSLHAELKESNEQDAEIEKLRVQSQRLKRISVAHFYAAMAHFSSHLVSLFLPMQFF